MTQRAAGHSGLFRSTTFSNALHFSKLGLLTTHRAAISSPIHSIITEAMRPN